MELGLEFLNSDMQQKLQQEHITNTKSENKEVTTENVNTSTNKQTETEDKKVVPSSTHKSSSPYVPFAKHLIEEGIISNDLLADIEASENPLESLVEGIRNQIDKYSELKINKYNPDIQELIALSESGVSKDKAKAIVKEAMELSKITDELLVDDDTMQENVVRQYLSKLGLSEEEQAEQLEYLKDTDKLYHKAKDAKSKLIDINIKEKELAKQQAEITRRQQTEAAQKQLASIKNEIDSMDEVIPGVKLSKQIKEKIYENLTTPVELDSENNPVTYVQALRSKDPVKFEILLNYFALQGLFEGKYDTLLKGTKTKTIEELEKTLYGSNLMDKGISTVVKQDDRNEESTKDLISSIPTTFEDLFKTK